MLCLNNSVLKTTACVRVNTRDLNEMSMATIVFSVLSVPATLVVFAFVSLASVTLFVSILVSPSVISFIVLSALLLSRVLFVLMCSFLNCLF